jgi:hypothetical protein
MFNPDEQKSKIDNIKESLYSRNADNIFVKRRHSLHEKANIDDNNSGWNSEDDKVRGGFNIPYGKILLGAFIFFALATSFAFYRFFTGSNTVSGDNIDILVSGPVSISSGDELTLDIEVKNKNNIDLKVVDLRIEYPDGTKKAENVSIDLKRYSEVLGDINSSQSEKRIIKAVLFGEENSQQSIKISVEYRVSGSNAIFSKTKDFSIFISSSPVNISVNNPTEVNANQLIDFYINVTSNSLSTVKGLIMKVEYPFGFNLSSSNPKSFSNDSSVFDLGDLAPGTQRAIRISGTIQGQDGEQRTFKFTVGTAKPDNQKVISVPLSLYTSDILVKKPFIGLTLSLNQDSGKIISVNAGSKLKANVMWQNNMTDKVYDMGIKIQFKGLILDKKSVVAEKGFYNSSENYILFDKSKNTEFSTVNPGDEGGISFDFSTLAQSLSSGVSFNNSEITMDISVLGSKAGNTPSNSQELLYSDTKTIKIASDFRLLARGYRTNGPFENSGPFPPKAENETTYTITWTATNSSNKVTNAQVTAMLPPNVSWTGFTSPDSEKITYDKSRGEILWNIGEIKPGVGTTLPSREVSFQVAIIPSVSQIGLSINLINESTISGIDAFTGARVGETKPSVTTNITSDSEYVENVGKVVQ